MQILRRTPFCSEQICSNQWVLLLQIQVSLKKNRKKSPKGGKISSLFPQEYSTHKNPKVSNSPNEDSRKTAPSTQLVYNNLLPSPRKTVLLSLPNLATPTGSTAPILLRQSIESIRSHPCQQGFESYNPKFSRVVQGGENRIGKCRRRRRRRKTHVPSLPHPLRRQLTSGVSDL